MSKSILDIQPISRVRRNHGLEHATINVLRKKFPHVALGGMSDPGGFTIVGEVTTEDVAEAAIEALKKLRSGDAELVMHPNCGTNFAISGAIAGLAAWLGTLGSDKSFQKKLERLPLVILLATVALVVSRPLGPYIQRHITTSGNPGNLDLERVETAIRAGLRLHRVVTKR
jgi:uncharacterized protein YqhQ